MKKRILIIIIILLLTTGCTCEYNLTIDGNNYKEEVIIIAENQEEISSFETDWEIPIDKQDYQEIQGFDQENDTDANMYNYKKTNNKLIFNYDFTRSQLNNSTAVSNCYNVNQCAKLLHELHKSFHKFLSGLFEVIILGHNFVYDLELVSLDVLLEHSRR